MSEKFKPAQDVLITPEGAEAGFLELQKRVESVEDLAPLKEIVQTYPEARVYLVGGIVRDAALGLPSDDFDFMISGIDQNELRKYLESCGSIVAETDQQTAVYKFLPKDSSTVIDIALPRRESYDIAQGRKPQVETEGVSIEEDLSRRDFTINAMALPVFSNQDGQVIDPFNGVSDIKNRLIKAVGEPRERFFEDPLRMLRAVRFACRFGFDIEEDTLATIQSMTSEVSAQYGNERGQIKQRVSRERVSKELVGAISANPQLFLELYNQTGLLKEILPEVDALKGVMQPAEFHSEGDAFVHTQMVLANLPQDASLELRLAALLHDIGKADTFQSAEETGDRIRFNAHDIASAKLAETILNRYRFPNEIKEKVVALVKLHMTMLVNFTKSKRANQKKLAKEPYFDDLVRLATADSGASLKPDGQSDTEHLSQLLAEVDNVRAILAEEEKTQKPQEIINGHQIIELIKVAKGDFNPQQDGHLIGQIKTTVNEAYHNGAITTQKEALALAEKLLMA